MSVPVRARADAGVEPRAAPMPRWPAARLALAVAAAFGLFTGLGEAAIVLGRRWIGGELSLFGPDVVWLAPVADLGLFLAAGLLYALAAAVVAPLRRPAPILGAAVALAAFALLSHVEGLHVAAAALLGLGVGSVAGRRRASRPIRFGRAAVGVGLVVGVLAVGVRLGDRVRERRSVASLPAARPGAPNVLLLVLDTVRAWNLGLYGYGRPTTPALDRRAQGGTVFNRVLATSPWTLPSHASLFTGRLPTELDAGWDRPLGTEPVTLAEVLRDAGYLTGGFVANYRYAGRSTGLARGFARYEDYPLGWDEALRATALARRVLRIPRVQEWLGRNRVIEPVYGAAVNAALLRWLDDRGERPFFAFLNYVDAHSPYLPPAPFDSMFAGDRDPRAYARRYVSQVQRMFRGPMPAPLLEEYLNGYDGSIRYLDAQLDSLFTSLESRRLLDNTIVVLTSDHGEHFGEHGLIQHGNSLYLPLLHVPLVVWGPGVPRGRRVDAPVSLRHVAATVLDLAGVARPGFPGRPLTRYWGADSAAQRDTLVSAVDWHANLSRFPPSPLLRGSLRAALVDSLHYIRRADGLEELYHPGRDFLEARNLLADPAMRGAADGVRRALGAALGPEP